MLAAATDRPARASYQERVFELFPQVTSESTVRGYSGVLVTLGLIERDRRGFVELTAAGRHFERTCELKIVRKALCDRVFGVRELIELLVEESMAFPQAEAILRERGVYWENPMALRYRIWWLRAAEALEADRRMRADWLRVTASGKALLRPKRG